jgi:integrase
VPKKTPQPVPAESFEKVLDKAPDDHMRAYPLCGWLAGLRLSEAYALEWEGTDGAPEWTSAAAGSSCLPARPGGGRRGVPLDAQLAAAGPAGFHFPSLRGERLTPKGLSTAVQKLCAKAGLRLTLKALRRGFGCCYAVRVPAQTLQKLLRHANISTTMDHYANVDDAAEAAVLQRNSSRSSRPAAPPAEDAGDDASGTLAQG